MSKAERARALLEKAKEAGCAANVEGNFVVFRPPLPVNLMLEAAELGDELTELLVHNA